MSVLISPSKSLVSSRWVTFVTSFSLLKINIPDIQLIPLNNATYAYSLYETMFMRKFKMPV